MIRYNQMANAQNPHQGGATKALCVCSAGLLRSPSIAKYLTEKGYNTRACGMSQEYALIPITPVLLHWADEIHIVEEQYESLQTLIQNWDQQYPEYGFDNKLKYVVRYEIPDCYKTFDPELMKLIEEDFHEVS